MNNPLPRLIQAAIAVVDDETPETRAELTYAVLDMKEWDRELRWRDLTEVQKPKRGFLRLR